MNRADVNTQVMRLAKRAERAPADVLQDAFVPVPPTSPHEEGCAPWSRGDAEVPPRRDAPHRCPHGLQARVGSLGNRCGFR